MMSRRLLNSATISYAGSCGPSSASTAAIWVNAAVHETVVSTLEGRGWEVDDCDLNAEGFMPVLTELERRGYHDQPVNIEPVAEYVDRIRKAEALIMVFPVWNFS